MGGKPIVQGEVSGGEREWNVLKTVYCARNIVHYVHARQLFQCQSKIGLNVVALESIAVRIVVISGPELVREFWEWKP